MKPILDNIIEEQLEFASDEELLARSLSEPALFEIIVDRFGDKFFRKALRIVGSREEAEDVVQETFAKIYHYGKNFKKQEGADFESWGYKILINTALTHYSREKRRRENVGTLDPELEEMIKDNKNELEIAMSHDSVRSVLLKMPMGLRVVLEKMFLEGWSGEDIAKSLGIAPEAVRARVHRAKKKFKEIADSMRLSII